LVVPVALTKSVSVTLEGKEVNPVTSAKGTLEKIFLFKVLENKSTLGIATRL
jgi:hypothetical protein